MAAFQAVLTQAPADGATLCGFPDAYVLEVRGAGMARVELNVDDPLILDTTPGTSGGLKSLRQLPFTVSEDGTTARLFINVQAQNSGGRHVRITAASASGQEIIVAERFWIIRDLQASKDFTGLCAATTDGPPTPFRLALPPVLTVAPADGAILCSGFSPYLIEIHSGRIISGTGGASLLHAALGVDLSAQQLSLERNWRGFDPIDGVARYWLYTASLSPGPHRVRIRAVVSRFAGVEEFVLAERTWIVADAEPCAPSISPNASPS
jgi:hypothetical protein